MSHFLVIYNRRRGVEPQVERIDDQREAQERLFQIEDDLVGDPDRGVVLLVAEREEDLRETHGHYFATVDQLFATVDQRLARAAG